MKVNVECTGCEITVEEVDGKCVVTAIKDGETVEEFAVDCGEGSDELTEELPEGDEVEVEGDELEEVEMDEESVEVEEEIMEEGVKTFSDFYSKGE